MMGRALLIVGVMATLGLIAAALFGYGLHGPVGPEMRRHVLVSLASCLLLLFSHCWIMFYLIGTGKAIKDAVKEHGLEQSLVEDTKRFKNVSYPWLMLAMGTAMATFILGGGAATGSLPAWVHHILFYATLLSQGRALQLENRVLTENERLMADLDRRLAVISARGAGPVPARSGAGA
jgi:4-hydroxybenzoate polyprenyltransferase